MVGHDPVKKLDAYRDGYRQCNVAHKTIAKFDNWIDWRSVATVVMFSCVSYSCVSKDFMLSGFSPLNFVQMIRRYEYFEWLMCSFIYVIWPFLFGRRVSKWILPKLVSFGMMFACSVYRQMCTDTTWPWRCISNTVVAFAAGMHAANRFIHICCMHSVGDQILAPVVYNILR